MKEFLQRLGDAQSKLDEGFARLPPSPAPGTGRRCRGNPRRGRRAPARQRSLRASALRRADAEAAASHRPRGLRAGDVDQPQQPCARRRTRQLGDGTRSGCGAGEDVRLAATPRPPLQQRDVRQPRSAVGCRPIASAQGNARGRRIRPGALHAHAHLRRTGPPVRRRSAPTTQAAWTSTRSSTRSQTHDIGTVVATLGTTAVGAVDPLDRILELQKKYGFRMHVDAAYGGYFTLAGNLGRRCARRLRCDSARRLPRRRSAQAWPAALRLRLPSSSATPPSAASTSTIRHSPTSPRRSCISARSPSNARVREPPP